MRQVWFDAFGLRLVQWAERQREVWPDIVAETAPDDQPSDSTPVADTGPVPSPAF